MISIIFFVLLFGCLGAMIIGTLGDEIQACSRGIVDRLHSDHTEKHLRKFYRESARRS